MNLRKQDGIKLHWLCKACELKFSGWEKYFSENVFHPLQEGQNPVLYNDNFLKFCVSISWRVLKYIFEQKYISDFSDEIQIKIRNALLEWKKFLLNQ